MLWLWGPLANPGSLASNDDIVVGSAAAVCAYNIVHIPRRGGFTRYMPR